jgi:hypothetical protein
MALNAGGGGGGEADGGGAAVAAGHDLGVGHGPAVLGAGGVAQGRGGLVVQDDEVGHAAAYRRAPARSRTPAPAAPGGWQAPIGGAISWFDHVRRWFAGRVAREGAGRWPAFCGEYPRRHG